MKKLFLLVATVIFVATLVHAQTTKTTTSPKKYDLRARANDHLVLQYGYTGWSGTVPDSVKPQGFSRSFNVYFMYDIPNKSNPKFSWALGAGLGTDNIFFDNKYVNLKSNTGRLPFTDVDSTDHFDKFKMTTIYLEAPIEFRYCSNPERPDHGYKASLGIKGGLLLKAYTKGKNLVDRNGRSIYGPKYIQKEYSNQYINGTRISAIGRVGYGNFSLFGVYQLTSELSSGAGVTTIKPFTVGLCISGL